MKKTINFILLITLTIGSFSCGKTVLEPADAPTKAPPKEGDYYQGGYVIYVDNDKKHGLIGAPYDVLPFGTNWSPFNTTTGATYSSRYYGINNTNLIIAANGTSGSYAALLCDQYTNDGYTDWYLPSLTEMNDLYDNKTKLGLSSGYYWSSTEYNSASAYAYDMTPYSAYSSTYAKSTSLKVRPVRKF